MNKNSPFRYFKTSPEIIRLAVMYYVSLPLSLRQVEDILHERGIDICHETVRYWWNRFGPLFANEISTMLIQTCDQCGGAVKVIACIKDPLVIKKTHSQGTPCLRLVQAGIIAATERIFQKIYAVFELVDTS